MSSRDKNEAHPGILTVILLGIFLGGGVTVFLAFRTFITIDALLLFFLTFGGLAFGIHYIIYRERKRYLGEILALCFVGWGSLMLASFMGLNYVFHHDEMTSRYTEEVQDEAPALGIMIVDSSYRNFHYLLNFEELEVFDPTKRITEIRITTATGLLGYRVIVDKEIIYQRRH